MSLVIKILLPMAFILVFVAGCAEQQEMANEKGKSVVDTAQEMKKKASDAVSKVQQRVGLLEQENQ